jgi:diadenylate cyclase
MAKKTNILDVLKLVAPGTVLRTAIDDILRAGMGALIVVNSTELKDIIEGGFRFNSKLSSQKIVELAKMDGAIVLSEDFKKILYANVQLTPDTRITTSETGTRHKAAERTAKQTGNLVIAISERRKKVSIYCGKLRYILQNTEELLGKTTETLRVLEKQREIFDQLLSNLNVLEISGLVVISDVCSVLQRISMIMKTSGIIKRDLTELGKEGIIIKMRLRELLKNIDKYRELILRDYNIDEEKLNMLAGFGFDELLNIENISEILFSTSSEKKIIPKGYRMLNKTNLQKKYKEKLIKELSNLDNILSADEKKYKEILGNKAKKLQEKLSNLKEQIMVGKEI